jgi:hypothetical protein
MAKLLFERPPVPAGISTTVGALLACDAEVEIGTTIIDLQPTVWLKAS